MDWITPLFAVLATGTLIVFMSRFGLGNVRRNHRDPTVPLQCSFCGKSQREVRKLIAGPTVYICDQCIGLCNDIIAEEKEPHDPSPAGQPAPRPRLVAEPERLLETFRGLSRAAHTMRRVWIIEDSEAARIIHAMADQIAALAEDLRLEISR